MQYNTLFRSWPEFWRFHGRGQDGVHAAMVYFRSAAGCTPLLNLLDVPETPDK
jgi:hypothetical protein